MMQAVVFLQFSRLHLDLVQIYAESSVNDERSRNWVGDTYSVELKDNNMSCHWGI